MWEAIFTWWRSLSATDWAAVAAIAAATSAIWSATATLGVFLQNRTAHKAAVANLINVFSERYNSNDMAHALRSLANWYRTTADSRVADWVRGKAACDPTAITLNNHRRLVSRFYFDAARLFELGLLNRRYAREVVSNNGLNVFYLVCEPMNVAVHPHRVARYSSTLRRLLKKYGTGDIHAPAQILSETAQPSAQNPIQWKWSFLRLGR